MYPDTPCFSIYRAKFLSPNRPGKSGFYCTPKLQVELAQQDYLISQCSSEYNYFKNFSKISETQPSTSRAVRADAGISYFLELGTVLVNVSQVT